jgi:TRAP transporter T-component
VLMVGADMPSGKLPALSRCLVGVLAACWLSGCSSLASSAAEDVAGGLVSAMLNQDDPQLVRDSLPAYLLLLESAARRPDAGATTLSAAAKLFSVYAILFVPEPERAARLAARARDYGRRALCADDEGACGIAELQFAELKQRLASLDPAANPALLSATLSNLAFVRTHAEDWQAIADLPRLEAVLEYLLPTATLQDAISINTYLGVLNTLRPESLGGKPAKGRQYFEQAIDLSGGRDLNAKVEFARRVYDRDLHDRLLNEVIAADPVAQDLTLSNILAQQQARELLGNAGEYF